MIRLTSLFLLLAGLSWGQFFNGGSSAPVGGLCAVQLYATASTLNGDNSVLCGVITALTPAAPTVTVQGTPGADTWSYAVVARNLIGASVASANGTVANGAAVLSGTDFNRVTTVAVTGSTSCDIYITVAPVGGSTGLIDSGNACGAVFDDQTGLGGGETPPTADRTTGLYDAGQLRVVGHTALGASAAVDPLAILTIAETITADGPARGVDVDLAIITAADNTDLSGLIFNIQRDASSANDNGIVASMRGLVSYDGTGTGNAAYGLYMVADSVASTGLLDLLNAFGAATSNTGDGDISTQVGAYINSANYGAGAVTNLYGAWFLPATNSGGGTVVNNVAVYIEDQSAVGTSKAFNIESEGSASVNSLEGRVTWGAHSFAGIGGLPTVDGDQIYCENCTVTSAIDNTCAGGGSGAQVFVLNGALKCYQ